MSRMAEDIRDRPRLGHEDIVQLNFIRTRVPFLFRRHYRTGLRSHIMEVLKPDDVIEQDHGVIISGVRWFPKAEPLKMLRIFRTRFKDLHAAQEELNRVRTVDRYLGPEHVARSEEFLVDYGCGPSREILLCGLQEYVAGEIIDPWSRLDAEYLKALMGRLTVDMEFPLKCGVEKWLTRVQRMAQTFLRRTRCMIQQKGLIPDLAGVGNLIMTAWGNMKVVDINNISEISAESSIPLDDKGYPVCDKSVQALAGVQERLAGEPVSNTDELYSIFLEPGRMKCVEAMVRAFHMKTRLQTAASSYPHERM